MLLSRSLLNVSPTQIFGQSKEDKNVSGATWKKKDASCRRVCRFFRKFLNMCTCKYSVSAYTYTK